MLYLYTMDMFETIYHSATESLIISNKDGIIEQINPATEELFGYKKNELIGEKIDILIPKTIRHKHDDYRKSYYEKPEKRNMGAGRDLFGQRKDGSVVPLEISLNHISTGEDIKVLAMITNITERKKIEEKIVQLNQELEGRVEERTKELQETQRLYRLIAQNFPKGTINVFDKNLNYVFVEGEELMKLGIDPKILIGTNYISHLPKEIRADVEEKLRESFKGQSLSFEIKSNINYYKINTVPIAFDKGNVTQILVVEKNITQEKLAEIKIMEALEREKQLNELKSRFVSMASHEFRTPLSTILSSASLTEKYVEKNDIEKIEKHIARIKSSVGLLTSILNDFLSLSKLEEDKIHLNISEFNVKELFEEIIDDLKSTQGKDITLLYHHIDGEMITSDKSFIKNIAYNLLSNAYKYGNSKVICLTKTEKSNLYLSVEDDGIGIPKDEQKNLFSRFFRAKNVMNIQGTGLGLNIVQHYLNLLQGKITFQSEKGKTIFEVVLPINAKNE
jgi:PAS domain S-box-containing protein